MSETDLVRVAYDLLSGAKDKKIVQNILVQEYDVGPVTAKMIADRALERLLS